MRKIFTFPNPVNEVAARIVATGVVIMAVAFLITGWRWLLIVLAVGFLLRVASGPRFSPLGQLATKVFVPRLFPSPKLTPGPPKRFAQAVGLTFSVLALVLFEAVGIGAAKIVIACLAVAASLEAFVGLCLGCQGFGFLMKIGIIPESVCLECADISQRYPDLLDTPG